MHVEQFIRVTATRVHERRYMSGQTSSSMPGADWCIHESTGVSTSRVSSRLVYPRVQELLDTRVHECRRPQSESRIPDAAPAQ
jgi:hypothetical protein